MWFLNSKTWSTRTISRVRGSGLRLVRRQFRENASKSTDFTHDLPYTAIWGVYPIFRQTHLRISQIGIWLVLLKMRTRCLGCLGYMRLVMLGSSGKWRLQQLSTNQNDQNGGNWSGDLNKKRSKMAPRNLQLKRRLPQASVWSSAKKYGDTTTKHVDVILEFLGLSKQNGSENQASWGKLVRNFMTRRPGRTPSKMWPA